MLFLDCWWGLFRTPKIEKFGAKVQSKWNEKETV